MTTNRRDRVRVRSGVRRSAIVASIACAIAAVRQAWVADAPNALTLDNVISIALTVAVVAIPTVVALGHDGLGRARMVGVSTIAVAAGTLTALTVLAANYVDNADRPVWWPLGTLVLLLPLALLHPVVTRRHVRPGLIAVHVVGAILVLDAARSCVDDDCLPIPVSYGLAGVAGIWLLVTELATYGTFSGDRPAEPSDRRGARVGGRVILLLSGGIALTAVLISIPSDSHRPACDSVAAQLDGLETSTSVSAWDEIADLQLDDARRSALTAGLDELDC